MITDQTRPSALHDRYPNRQSRDSRRKRIPVHSPSDQHPPLPTLRPAQQLTRPIRPLRQIIRPLKDHMSGPSAGLGVRNGLGESENIGQVDPCEEGRGDSACAPIETETFPDYVLFFPSVCRWALQSRRLCTTQSTRRPWDSLPAQTKVTGKVTVWNLSFKSCIDSSIGFFTCLSSPHHPNPIQPDHLSASTSTE